MDEQHNPYQASPIADDRPGLHRWHHVPADISSPIKHMWVLALTVACFRLVVALGSFVALEVVGPAVLAILLADVLALATLALFVRRRSRTAACLLLAYYLASKLVVHMTADSPVYGAMMTVLIGFVMIRGTLAVFRHHRFMREEARRPPRLRLSEHPMFTQSPPRVD